MLTANYFQRSPSKWKLAIIFILVISAMITAFSFSINRYLPKYALAFCDILNQQLALKVSFSSIHYRFPIYLILKNVKVCVNSENAPMLAAHRIVMSLSIPFSASGPSFNNAVLDHTTMDLESLKNYWRKYRTPLSAWTHTLPRENSGIIIHNGELYLKGLDSKPFPFEVDFSRKQDHVSAQGFWINKDKFNFQLYGDLAQTSFNLSKLFIEGGPSSINLWGKWQENTIDWKGFILYKQFYILDIHGHLNIADTDIVLKSLSFSVNGNDMTAQGSCSKLKLFSCEGDMTLARQKQHPSYDDPLKKISLHLSSQNTPKDILFNGQADLYFLFDPHYPWPLKSMHVNFKNLKTRLLNTNFLKLKIDHIDASWMSPDEHKIPVENLLASVHLDQPHNAIIGLSARMYQGRYRGRVFIDTATTPWIIKGQGKIDGTDISRLGRTFFVLEQYRGILNSRFDFQSSKSIQLNGTMVIRHGDFNDLHFLPWLANLLQMPALGHLQNAELSCRFKIDEDSKNLDDFKLHTDDLDLSGFFYLDAQDLVSSRISVRFSKTLLGQSPIGRNLMGLVREAWALPFEFKLSGNIYKMNFQWDKSPLKDKVRQHIFPFMEKIIDQQVESPPSVINERPGF
ncbi:MAG: hypothetical protein HQL14_06955 [Candidatus Omnitrophica bacterium]|nr:hypothetical protein [Candidatus Omnitrophota bacterium]